ncbi:hypothetical protein KUCAC02_007041, partial [Chaenocephalus aceratus]
MFNHGPPFSVASNSGRQEVPRVGETKVDECFTMTLQSHVFFIAVYIVAPIEIPSMI